MDSTENKNQAEDGPSSTSFLGSAEEKLDNLGTAVKELLPIPSDTQPVTDPTKTEVSHTLMDDPSLSHELATEDHEVKGLAQQDHPAEVLDLGWNQKKQEIAEPLVGGLDNEELWILVRRFNKVSREILLLQSGSWS